MPRESIEIEPFPPKKKSMDLEYFFVGLAYGCILAALIVALMRATCRQEIARDASGNARQTERRLYSIANAAASQQVQVFRDLVIDAAEVAARRAIHEHMHAAPQA